MTPYQQDIDRVAKLLKQADSVLIGAGSGLTAAAGIDYTDKVSFAKNYPAMVKRGFRMKAQFIGYNDWTEELMWGYWSMHLKEVRYDPTSLPTYEQLFKLIQGKEYFVITTNVDGLFPKSGFDEEYLYTPQGDYARMQCTKPCTNETWDTWPIIEKIIPTIDTETQLVTDPKVIPQCPNCGERIFPNVRADNSFIDLPYQQQRESFGQWVNSQHDCNLVIFDIGTGPNTPVVVRYPMEKVAHHYRSSSFVRINLQYADVPHELIERSVSLKGDASQIISDILDSYTN